MGKTTNTDTQRQTASGKGGASSRRGKRLFAVGTDRKRIGLEILLRAAASAFVVGLTYYQGRTLAAPILAVFGLFSVWPLLHMGDKMELYESGVLCAGEWYPIGAGTQVVWTNRRGFFLPITWLDIGGHPKGINVSFMKDAEKLFNRAYHNAIYEKGE